MVVSRISFVTLLYTYFMFIPMLSSQFSIGLNTTINSFEHETFYNVEGTNSLMALAFDSEDLPRIGIGFGVHLEYEVQIKNWFGLAPSVEIGRYQRKLTPRGRIPGQQGLFTDIGLNSLFIKPSARVYFRHKNLDIFAGYMMYKFTNHSFSSMGEKFKVFEENSPTYFYKITSGPLLGLQIKFFRKFKIQLSYNKIITPQIHYYGRGLLSSFNKNNNYNILFAMSFK